MSGPIFRKFLPDCVTLFFPLCMALIEDFVPFLARNQINQTDFKISEKPTGLVTSKKATGLVSLKSLCIPSLLIRKIDCWKKKAQLY